MDRTKGHYSKIDISLEKAENGLELHLTGDYLTIISITGSGTCEIKLNHRHSQTINLREISEISGGFDRIYLTTDGGGGICTVFVGDGITLHLAPSTQRDNRKGSYTREEFSLESAESNKLLDLTGDYLNIITTTGAGTCEVKLNSLESETINLREVSEITESFEGIYFTTDGAGGVCALIVGKGPAHIGSISEKLWSGDVLASFFQTSPGFHARFSATTKKITKFVIWNTDFTYYIYVGKYFSDYATFIANAIYVAPRYSETFEKVDLFTLGYGYYNGNVTFQVIGTET